MEIWGFIFIAWIIFAVISSVYKNATGSRSIDARLVKSKFEHDEKSMLVYDVEIKGFFPVVRETNLGFIISIFDVTSGKSEPIVSLIDVCREYDSPAFEQKGDFGTVGKGHAFVNWTKVGQIAPEYIVPPIGGSRKLSIVFRLVDIDRPPAIHFGAFVGGTSPVWEKELKFEHNFTIIGYEQASKNQDEAIALSLKVAMAVAMADGSLDETEGLVLKSWIEKSISVHGGDKKASLKTLYNLAMKEAYTDAKNGKLLLSKLTERLNEIGDKVIKYEAIELCFEVMKADGIIDDNELKMIDRVGEALQLDMKVLEELREPLIIEYGADSSDTRLGIKSDWSKPEKRKYLRSEYTKWNNRLNTLAEGKERENAQSMLDSISEAMKRHQ